MSIVRVIGQRGNFEATPYFSTFGYYTGNNENISQEILNIKEEWNIMILEFIMKSTTELLKPPTLQ